MPRLAVRDSAARRRAVHERTATSRWLAPEVNDPVRNGADLENLDGSQR